MTDSADLGRGDTMLSSLFNNFSNIVVFDVETTGTDPKRDEIIEIAMLRTYNKHDVFKIEDKFSSLVKLTTSKPLPAIITNLTGITDQHLLEDGISKENACVSITGILDCQNPLLVAYNAQFDLSFLYHLLNRHDKAAVLKNAKMLDLLTIYRDRRPYPHKLTDAAQMYSLDRNGTHRALSDAQTTLSLLCKMWNELDDIMHYVNLFGYNPKYGVSGSKISSVRYLPQGYDRTKKLYET